LGGFAKSKSKDPKGQSTGEKNGVRVEKNCLLKRLWEKGKRVLALNSREGSRVWGC